MGGLNSGPGPGITLLIAFVLILCSNVLSAPLYEEDDTQVSNAQGVIEPQGCYYNFQHYNEGERILTNEPCLNCTCRNRMLMCYLRVCPFTKGIGQNCTVEKVPGQCCPIITCPEVPVQLLTSSTTEHSEDDGRRPEVHHGIKGTAVGHLDNNGCQIDGVFYPNGAQVPGNPEKPCELCYCIRNKTACIMQACALHVDGCRPIYEDGQCFPVRYQCDDQPYEEEPTTTIRPAPTPGLIITTTSSEPLECFYNNEIYEDGSRIQTEDPCEHCYCLKGKIACAVQECGAPLEKEGQNCTALPPAPGKCCPDSYQCDDKVVLRELPESFLRKDRKHKFEFKPKGHNDITMSSQKFGQGSEGTTEAGFSSVADAGHPTDGHYPGEHGATKTTEKPKYGTNQQSGDVTEGLTPEAVTPSKGVSGKPSVISDGQGPHMDKGQPGSPDSSDLEHHEELDKGTQLPTKHHDSLPNEYEGTPEDVSNVPGKQKITSTDETKPGVTKRPVYGTKPEIMLPSSGFPNIPGSLNELVQRQNQSQTDPMSSIHHTGHKEKPQGQKPEQYGDEKEPMSGSKPQEPSSADATKVQDGIQTTQGSGHPTTESEHILHVMEQQKPAPGIESHIQDTSSTKRPYDEGLSTLNADSTEKTGSTKPSYSGHWKPQPGIYQPDLQGTPFDASHGQTSPDRTKPVFPGSDRLPEDGYSTPIPAIDEDQNVKGQMTVSNAKDQLIDKLHNIIQDVQAQVNDGKTTEMPEEADYKTTTQSQKGHFTEKPDTIPHLHHGSQESHHPLGSDHDVPTTKPSSDKETQPANVVTDTPKDTSDIFNKIQGIIHGMFTQVTEAVQTTLAPLTSGDVDGKQPSKVDEESSSASPEHKPDTTHKLKPSDGSSKHPPGTKPADSYEHPDKEGLAGAPDNSNKRPQGSGSHYPQGSTKYPGYTESTTRKHGSTQTTYPDGSKPEDSEFPSITQYPDYISPDGETGDYGKYPEGSRPEDTSYGSTKYPEGSKPTDLGKYPHGTEHQDHKTTDPHQNKYPEGFKPSASKPHDDETYSHGTKPTASDNYPFGTEYPEGVGVTGRPQDHSKYPSGSEKYPYYPHGTEYPDEVGSTLTPDELGKYPDGTSPVKGSEGVKHPSETSSTGKPHYSTKYPGSKYPEGVTGKPTGSEDQPYGTEYPEDVGSTGRPQDHGKYPEGTKPSGSQKYPHYPHGTEYPDEIGSTVTPDEYGKYPDGTSPVKTPEGVKYPGQTGSTGRPQYSTKYPGSKYPEGVTGKPIGSENQPYGTEYPEEIGVTGRPQEAGEYPEGTKPSGSQKYPHYPHGTEYPDEVGSTVTPDEFGKYPDGTSPVKGSEGVKYPGQTGSTGKPHYSTKYPGSKYPEGVTGKPTGSEDQPYGTEYPEDVGSTGRPQVHGKYPEGTKPSGSHKYPHYPHGTDYPDEIGSTITPDELGKYPDGISPVKGSGGLKHPSEIGSTGRPHYSTKYPDGVSGKPSDVNNKPYGTENPEGVGVTGRPQGAEKYPEGAKPTHSESDHPYGTEYPEGETGTDRPYDPSKYPEETKPVRGPDGVVYPGQTESAGRPQVGEQYLEGTRPHQSQKHPLATEYPDKEFGTDRPYGANKYPTGFRPNEKYPGGSQHTGTEAPEYSTMYPNEYDSNVTPDVSGKYPHGSKPTSGIYRPDGTKYPDHTDTTGRPQYPGKYPEGFDPAQKPQGSTQHFGRPTGKPFGTEEYPYGTDHPEGQILTGKPHDTEFGSTSRPDDSSKYPYQTEYPEGFTGKPDDLSGLPDGSRPVRPGYRPQDSKYPTGSPFDSTRFPVGSRPTFRPIELGKYPESSTQISGQENVFGTQSPYEGDDTSKPQTTGKYPSDVSRYPDDSKPTYSGKYPETGDSKKPHDSQTDRPEGSRPSGSPQVTSKYPEGLTDKPYDLTKYPQESKPSDKYPFGTEYPEGVGSTVQPNELGKYPEETSPVKETEGIKHPDQTGSTGRPQYPAKYPGSKYPEGITGKPSDTEDQPYGTKYPEGAGVTGRPQGAEKYPEGVKPTDSDSERPYGTEYPEGETGTDKPYDSSKYPDRTKPEGVSYPGQTGSTERPHYSTKYPGSKFPEEVTDTEQESHATKYPEDVGGTGKPEYSEKYPEKVKPVGKPDEIGKYPDGAKPSDSNELPGGEEPENQPEGEGSETDRPYDTSKHPVGYRPNDKYPEGLKPTDSQESTKVPDDPNRHPDDGASSESVTDHQVGSTDQVSTDRPDLIKRPEGYRPTGDAQEHPDDSKPTDKNESKPDPNTPSGQKKHGEPGEGGLKPEQSEKSPDDTESLNKEGTTGKPEYSSHYPGGAQPTSSDKYPFSTKYPDEAGSTTKPDEFEKHPGHYRPDGKPEGTGKFPESIKPEDLEKYPHGSEHPTAEVEINGPHDPNKYPEGTKPVLGQEGVKYPAQTESSDKPNYSTKYPGSKYPEGVTGKPTGSEDQAYGTEYPEEDGLTGRPHDHSKYPEESKPTSQKHPHYPHGTEYPEEIGITGRPHDQSKYPQGTKPTGSEKYPHGTEYPYEVGSTVTPDEFGKYPDGTSPVKAPEGVKYPGQTGSTGKPHYSTKYPGSKSPEGVTGKPIDSEDEPYGTEYPEEVGVTGRPHDQSKYPQGTKPTDSQKYPHGTEYPDEIGSTVTPNEFGKYPDGTSPVKGSEGVKLPDQFESTGKPHYSTKYPGVSGKPIGSENQPYGTENPEGSAVTGQPQDQSKYPLGTKPSGSEKYPHYPHGTEYPDEIGSTVTPDEYGKYPDGSSPVTGSEGVKYPGQTGSTGRPQYPTKYPGGKYPEGITGKPTGSEDPSYGTEYSEGFGVTDRPQDLSKYPEGTKPSGSDKYPHYPHGTESPEGIGSTVTPDEFGKYPEGTSPVKGSEGVKHPIETESTGRPHYSTKYPGSKYPEEVSGKPSDADDKPYGTEYPEGVGVTGTPEGAVKYPEGAKPTHSDPELPYGTEYPEGETGTDKPYHSSKYPEGSKPVQEPDGVKYPGQTGSTGQPFYSTQYPDGQKPTYRPEDTNKLSEGVKPTDENYGTDQPHGSRPNDKYPVESQTGSDHEIHTTEFPEDITGTSKPNDLSKYPGGSQPSISGHKPEEGKYPESPKVGGKPKDPSKHPEGTQPEDAGHYPHGTEYPDHVGGTGKPYDPSERPDSFDATDKFSEKSTPFSHVTKHPNEETGTVEPFDFTKHPDGSKPLHSTKYPEEYKPTGQPLGEGTGATKYPGYIGSTLLPHVTSKYPGDRETIGKPEDSNKLPEEITPTEKKPGAENDQSSNEYPNEILGTDKPYNAAEHPEGFKPHYTTKHPAETIPSDLESMSHSTKYPHEPAGKPDEFVKHPDGKDPVREPGVTYPDQSGSPESPHYPTKYPGSHRPTGKPQNLLPEGFTGTPIDSEDQPHGTEPTDEVGLTDRPQNLGKYPEGSKQTSQKHPQYPYGTEYPDEVGSTLTPDELEKYPDGTSPVKGSEGVKHPSETSSTGKPHYSTKYPGSKYPEGVTGKPTGSEDQPYGTEYPEDVDPTGKPQDHGKYPEGTKPSGSQKYPHYPHGTEYPDEIGSTVTPDEYGKYPDGTSPVKTPEGVKYPGQTGSTGRPQYSTKYPGSKYPEGVTGKPIGSENQPYGTEYPEEVGVTGRPQGAEEYPEGTKPSGSQKYPHYPHGTEYPDEVGSTVTPDEFGKYPVGTSPVKGPEGVKYPGQTGSTGKPHYSTKYPGSKYPDGFTGKPSDSEDQPLGTEYPEGFGVTDVPQGSSNKRKPTFPGENLYGTEYPGEETETDKPYHSSKYPEGTKPVSGPEGVKYPDQTLSTGRPQYADTDKHPDYNRVTDIPFDTNKFPGGTKPEDSAEHGPSTKHPDGTLGTTKSHDSSKYPEGVQPSTSGYDVNEGKYPGFTKVTEKPFDSTKYPEGGKPSHPQHTESGEDIDRPHEKDKHPDGLETGVTEKHPDVSKYPSGTEDTYELGSTIKPESDGKLPVGFKPTDSDRPSGDTHFSHPEGVTDSDDHAIITEHPGVELSGKPDDSNKFPEGFKPTGRPQYTGKYPEGIKPTDSEFSSSGTEYPESSKYPDEFKPSSTPNDSSKYPEGVTPSLLEKHPEDIGGSRITVRPDGVTEYPGEYTGKPHNTNKYPHEAGSTSSGDTPYGTEYPSEVGSSKYPDKLRPTGRPHGSTRYPEGSKPSVTDLHSTVYPYEEGSTDKPNDLGKYPEKVKPTDFEKYPFSTKYPGEIQSTSKPDAFGKYPEEETRPGTKPHDSEKYPESEKPTNSDKYPHSTEYPINEVGSTVTPDEYGKYPDGTSPVKGSEGVKHPGQTGSTSRPHYSTKYPGSKYPEGVTGKPTGSEDQPYGTEYPEDVDPTGKPQDHGKYPEGTKPSGSQKYPHYPHGTEYPDEIGSTVTPDEYGKYPDGTSPVKTPEGVKYPGQTGSTGRPQYSTKYPGSKYPEGVTGKPIGSENQPYGTEYPEEVGVTGRPQDAEEYPEGTKPSGSQKYPHYPHGTEYPDEIGSTVTPDEFGKYPDGTSPVKTPEGVKYPGQTGSTGKPHYSTKYPGSKYPEGVTGKPIDSEDQPYGTEFPEGVGVSGRPHEQSKYPLGTEYPEEVGSTINPGELGKYPDGISPVTGSEGVKHPSEIGSTVKPHYSTKYPDEITGKPTGSEDQTYGTKYPIEVGLTGRPQDIGRYPEGSKPTSQKHPHYPHGTEYPDEIGTTVTPDEFGKYPEGTSPVKGSEGVKHPIDPESTDRPHYSTKYPGSKYPEGVTGKPSDADDKPYGTEYPEGVGVTGTPEGAVKYPEGAKPTHSDPELPYGTEYPEEETGTDRPHDLSKYPEGTKPVRGPDGIYPSQPGSTGKPQGVGEYPEEGKPIPGDKYPDGVKPTTPKDSSYGTQYPDRLGGSTSDASSSTPDSSVYDSVSKQPGSMYLPQFPQTGKPFSPTDDKDKPLELPEESYSVRPGHDSYGSSTPKSPESIGITDKPGVPVPDQSIDEMDVATHGPDEYPKRPDSADLTHDPEYRPQSGEHSSKHPSKTSSTQSPDSNLHAQYPATNEPSTDQDGKVAPQGVKAPQDDLLPTRPGSESPHTEKTLSGVSTPKHGSSETERPIQGLSGHDQSTTDQYGSPIKHPDDKQGSTSPGSVNKYSESSDEYSTTEYSNQDGITGKPSGTHTKRPVEQPSRPGQEDVYTTQQPSEGRPTHGVGHPEDVSPGSEGFDGNVYETTTLSNDDLINKLQSIISGIQTQVTNDKTTRQPSTSDLNAPFGQTTEILHEGEQKPQDHSEQPHESVEYATEKPNVTGDKRRPIDGVDSTKPHATEKPLAGPVDELTTGLGEEATEGYLEEENEIHDPEGHFSKKPSSGSSTEFPETGRPTGTKSPGEETVGSHSTKQPEGYTDQPAGKPHDTSVQTQDENKPTSSTDRYPEEGDKVPASGEKVTGKPDDSIHFPDEKPGSPTSESSTPGVSDEHTPTRKTGSTQVGSDDVSSTIGYDSEKPEDFDSSTKKPGTHHDTRPTISQTETGDNVHETSSTPKDGVLGVTKTPETDSKPQKGVTKPGDRPGIHQSSKPDDGTHPHGEENIPIYHGVESMAGKPTDQPDSMIGEDHTVLPEEDSAGTKKPLKSTEKPSHGVPLDEETGQVEKHPSHQEPTEKPLHVVYPTYYPDGIITRKPGSRPQDLGNKVTVTPQSNVYGTSTPSKEDDDATQSVGDREVMKPTSKVPTDGSSLSSGEPVTEGLVTEGSTKRVVPQEGFTTGDLAGKPHAPVDKHPDSSLDDTQGSGESSTTSPVIIIEEVHTEVHSERATTKPGTESYDQTTKSVYPHGSDENLTEKPETFDRKTTKKPDLFSPGSDSVFQEGKPGYESTVHPLSTDRPQDSLYHTSQPSHGSSVPVHGITESYPDVLVGSTTDESLYQGTGKPVYQTKHPESPDGKSTNEPGLVTDSTTPSADHSGQPGSQHIMNLYSPKEKYSTTISPEIVKGTEQPGSFTTGSRVPGVTEEGSLYTTSKPDDSHQGPTFDHEIFGSKFPGRKTTQKPLVTPEAQPDFTTVFEVGTTREPQEGVTSTPTQGINVEHHIPSFIFPQKQPEHGATEGYITQGKPLTTVGQPGVIFEGKQTTPSYQFITSGTHDPEIATKKPFQPSIKGASYVPYRIIDGRKVYYPEREVSQKPDEDDKHGFDGFDCLPYEIINGKKFFKPNEVVSQPVQTSTTPKHRLGMYVPYKIINGTKVYYTEDPQGKPHAGVEDYDGLDYVPFDIINGTKVFYPEAVNEPTSPTFQETTTRPSYIMAMYVPYKIINGTKVYYPEDSPNKPESEDYDGLDYVPYEIVNGKKVFYPERVATPPKGTSTPSYIMAMYVPYKIINGTKVYYPEDPQGKPQSEDYDGLDYVPFEMINGTKVFYPERVTATPEATTKPAHTMAMYVPYKIVNGTKVYYPEEPQVDSEGFDGLDYVPFEIVNGTKVFYPERVSTTSYEGTTTPSYPSAMYVPYKIVDGRKVYYPKYAQYKPYKVPEGFVGFDYIPYEIVNGSKVFYPDRATTVRPTAPPTKHHQGMYVPYKIVNGTKIYYPKDAEEKPQGVLDGYDGSDYVPYEIVNGTQVFYPEKATTEKPAIKAMYVPYKIVDGTKVYYAKDAQPTPNLIPKGYDGFDFVPYEIVNGTRTFYPERVTTSTPAPNELYYTQGMYVPYKIVDGRKVYYPQRAQHNPLEIPEGFEGFDYILYDIVNGTKVFHPERVTGSPAPTHAPSGTFYPQGMYVPFRVINGTKVFYPQDAQHRPDPMKNDYDGWQHLPYDIVNGTKVFYPERVTTEPPVDTMSAMYVPFKMINGTKVFYVNDAQYQPYLIPEGYDGFEYVPYEIVNGTKKFYPSSHYPTTAKPSKQGMFVPYKIINGAKVYYPKHASDSPRPPSSEYSGVDFIPYEVINGTKVFYPDRIQGPELETSGTQAMYVPYKMVNGTKVFYPKDAQFKPYLIPEGYDGFDYLPYEIKNGTKVFYPERLTVTQRPEQVPSQGMFVPYKMINGQKVYYPKEAQKRPHPLSNEYDGLDYVPYEVVNGTKVFYPEYVTQSADMSGTPMSQAMYVPYKIINGTKVFYPKYAQHKPHLVPDGYDGFEYVPYKIVNGTKFFYPDRVATKPQKLQGMYVPYKIINGTKVFYPKYAQPTLQQLPKGFDGIDYIPYEVVNGTKVFYPEKATPSGVSGTPVVQALYVPYKIINGKKVFYPKYAVERPQTIPEGYDGFAYMPYSIVNGTKMFYPEQAQFPGVNKVPSLQGTFVPYKLLNSTKVFYPKYANDESPRVPDGYDGVDYVPYEPVNGTKVFYPELISPQASSGTSPVPGKYVPYKVVNGKKVFYPKEGKPQYPSGGVRYPYDGIVYVPYKSLSGTSPSRPENYPPFVTPEHSLYGQNSEIVYVDDDDESFRPQFISQSRPSQEQTGSHIGHVPGEGSCFLNNKTYENNMEIPPVSPCQSRCRCINSIVRCVRIKCPPLPQSNTANCSPVYDEGSCCPTYSCENDDLDYLTTTEFPEMVLTGSSSTVISFGQGFDSTTQFAVTDASPHKSQYGQDGAGDFSGEKPHPSRKPVTSDGQHPTDQYHIHRPQKPKPSEQGSLEPYDGVEGHPMPGEFSSEDDYDGEDEEPYGPGTCRYAGKVYVSAQQIPRDDPCDFCFCFRSDIICLQQSCPPPIPGCRDEPIQGFCCPRYECHVKMATLLNVTSTTTTTTTTLPPHFFLHPYKGSATRTGCFVQGKAYRVGQAIPSASGPCMDCICRGNGRMECEPKVCTPEPMIRKMIVPAENTTSPSSER